MCLSNVMCMARCSPGAACLAKPDARANPLGPKIEASGESLKINPRNIEKETALSSSFSSILVEYLAAVRRAGTLRYFDLPRPAAASEALLPSLQAARLARGLASPLSLQSFLQRCAICSGSAHCGLQVKHYDRPQLTFTITTITTYRATLTSGGTLRTQVRLCDAQQGQRARKRPVRSY